MGYVQELRWFAHISRCTMLCKEAVHTKNCCGDVHTIECALFIRNVQRLARCAPQQELWEVLCILWEVYIIEGVRIVGGAIGMCARLWKKYTQRVVGAVRTIARIVGGAMGCGVSRRKSIRG